jgi:hypothetical protein
VIPRDGQRHESSLHSPGRDVAAHSPTGAESANTEGQNETPGQLALAGGFNVTNLAVSVTHGWNSEAWKQVVQLLEHLA